MAQLTKANITTKFNDSGAGLFKDNTGGEIGADDARTLVTDFKDSVPFTTDDSYLWAFPKADTSGTDAYTATLSPLISSYPSGMKIHIKIKTASSGAATLNLNDVGPKKIMINPTTQAGAGDLVDEQEYIMSYDSALDGAAGAFLIIGGGGSSGPVDAGDVTLAPSGNLAATNVQDGLYELQTDVDALDTDKQALVNSATALTDAASMDLTSIKHTLTTSSATRTFTISYTGDDITLVVTLNTTATVFTFPATALCVSEGFSSGDNTCTLGGASGDKYVIAIKKVGSAYYVACKNFGQ